MEVRTGGAWPLTVTPPTVVASPPCFWSACFGSGAFWPLAGAWGGWVWARPAAGISASADAEARALQARRLITWRSPRTDGGGLAETARRAYDTYVLSSKVHVYFR